MSYSRSSSRSSKRIYVGNLPEDVRESELDELFAKFGKIRDIDIKYGRTSNRTAYAFIDFATVDAAEEAIEGRDGYRFAGVRLRVEWSGDRRVRHAKVRGGPPTRTEWRVIVTGLPKSASWQDLKDHMRQAGPVGYADARDGRGVVEYETERDMVNAIKVLNGSEFINPFNRCTIEVHEDRGGNGYSSEGSGGYSPHYGARGRGRRPMGGGGGRMQRGGGWRSPDSGGGRREDMGPDRGRRNDMSGERGYPMRRRSRSRSFSNRSPRHHARLGNEVAHQSQSRSASALSRRGCGAVRGRSCSPVEASRRFSRPSSLPLKDNEFHHDDGAFSPPSAGPLRELKEELESGTRGTDDSGRRSPDHVMSRGSSRSRASRSQQGRDTSSGDRGRLSASRSPGTGHSEMHGREHDINDVGVDGGGAPETAGHSETRETRREEKRSVSRHDDGGGFKRGRERSLGDDSDGRQEKLSKRRNSEVDQGSRELRSMSPRRSDGASKVEGDHGSLSDTTRTRTGGSEAEDGRLAPEQEDRVIKKRQSEGGDDADLEREERRSVSRGVED